MTINELLDIYEKDFAMTEAEKGERFERLMRNFLLTYPAWRGQIVEAWLWKDFPFRHDLGGKDLGIDIVAKTVDGEFWAAQCKFYADTTTIDKKAVDSFVSNSGRTFGGDKKFSRRLWISTTDNFTDNAREMLKNQSPAVEVINLEFLRRAQVNWILLDNGFARREARIIKRLRDYQWEALYKARAHYQANDRGRLIMACGTGKTFTALKIAEALAPEGLILFLVPSISLLSQTLEEWAANSVKPLNAVCVCSDDTAAQDADEITDVQLPFKATTDHVKIADALTHLPADRFNVVFSTYQSLEQVSLAQKDSGDAFIFDLIICDEAHRTTGSSKDEKTQFTAVHDEDFIKAKRRMYMTATPRMFTSDAIKKAATCDINVWSMDDEKTYGKEFYRLNFGTAVAKEILSDYKVLVLTLNEKKSGDKNADDATKIAGTINALAKKMTHISQGLATVDPTPMHTAVAFCPTIADSKRIAATFDTIADKKRDLLDVHTKHVDGSQSGKIRNGHLSWLKTTPVDGNACRILTNVRCLSEGVDVPALDSVIFMASKKSKVEIVQAVGRVMRQAPHKNYGYIIIPVVVPLEQNPEDVLDKSKTYNVIWEVLNALRSHDGRIDIFIEDLKLQRARGEKPGNNGDSHIIIGGAEDETELDDLPFQDTLNFGEWQDFLYARMVERVGNRRYWEQWAADIAQIAQRHTDRIKELIACAGDAQRDFYNFVHDLQQNINPAVTPEAAVEMLAQHIVSRPVFDALFEDYPFVKNNPVSKALETVLAALDTQNTDEEAERLQRFAESVRERCSIIHTAQEKQQIVNELYEKFFRIAVPKTVDKLGIVYTPVEVVDFILRSVDAVLKKNFGRGLSDKNVHVLDPFAGTGTFIVRLIQSGLINPRDLKRKYLHELHANEIVLLAYYLAAIDVENAYLAAAADDYVPFNGVCFTDTFQAAENDENAKGQTDLEPFRDTLHENAARVKDQLATPIQVIVGNPPYSVGQRSANDNAKNDYYPKLETRIQNTYAKINKTLTQALYDSYIKAFRWASDRISDGGVIGFITNANWIDKDTMHGLRKCFAEDFSEIYVFNLRGDIRNKEKSDVAKDGGNIFNIMTGVAVTILVKNPDVHGDAKIFYRDIGDYLTREQKLEIVARTTNVLGDDFKPLTPNDKYDWINQRGDAFDTLIPLAPETKFDAAAQSFFAANSMGITTNRDTWAYNFSRPALEKNMQTTIDFYNTHEPTDVDSTKITWTRATVQNKNRGRKIFFNAAQIVESVYRPFCKEFFYRSRVMSNCVYQMPKFFPTGAEENLLICVPDVGGRKNFSVLVTNKITDLHFNDDTQCFPLYWYEAAAQGSLFGENLQRRDGISDFILNRAQNLFVDVTREDIFYYVYGFLHLPSYREKFANELKKSLPRIILVDDTEKFWSLSRAGRELAEIHLNYETQEPAQVEILGTERGNFAVTKLRLSKDKTTLTYNRDIKIKNIPPRSFEYVVNGRSPLEWIIDRYQVKTDKSSGIINNPNDWSLEHDNPRYILDLILSCITVSLKTLDIVDALPAVDFDG